MTGHCHHWATKILSASSILLLVLFVPIILAAQPQSSSLTIQGTVREARGAPIAGASIQVVKNDSSLPESQTQSDAAGKFSISARNAGTYFLRVQKPGFNATVEQLTVPFGEPHSCDIVLSRSATHAPNNSAQAFQFSDKPDFTVAGVTDWTAAGGHGSDVNLRTSEALARDTRGLEKVRPSDGGNSEELQRRREKLQKELATRDSAELHRELGDLDEQMNDSLAAVHEYERAAHLNPSEQNYFAWGTELLLHRAIQPAVEVFSKGAAAYPRSERMLAGMGAALYASGLYAQAAERLCAASDLKPADITPYLFLGKMVQASAQPLPCSEEKLARFAHDQPSNPYANYYYALAMSKQGGSEKTGVVERFLKKTISINANFGEAYVLLGNLYSARNQNGEAISEYEKAKAANPSLAEARFRLGQAYKKAGQAEKARQEFQAYEQIQKAEAAGVEQQRREIQQFVIVFKEQPQIPPHP